MRPITAAAAIGTLLLATACGGSDGGSEDGTADKPAAAAKPGASVAIPLLSFSPDKVSVKAGQTVTWVNGNDISHVLEQGSYQVGADGLRTSETSDGAFSLKVAKKGDTVSFTYPKAGTYTYFCTIHKGMNAAVTVS